MPVVIADCGLRIAGGLRITGRLRIAGRLLIAERAQQTAVASLRINEAREERYAMMLKRKEADGLIFLGHRLPKAAASVSGPRTWTSFDGVSIKW